MEIVPADAGEFDRNLSDSNPDNMGLTILDRVYSQARALQDMFEGRPEPGGPSRRGSLSGDDRNTAPLQLWHLLKLQIGVAVDHLVALADLHQGAGVLHPYAPFSLSRASIGSASTAAWVLEPTRRVDRITRRLRVGRLQLLDPQKLNDTAAKITGKPGPPVKSLVTITQIAKRLGIYCRAPRRR